MKTSDNRILRLPEVIHLTGLSRSLIYQMIKVGRFPRQFKISRRCVGWNAICIFSWVERQSSEPDLKK
jgi:prophage regulatory protein